jgi:D-beta-D-heptose 7-phosphate kinase/D-beta-D-heptose 1-phosphate adenosyltransferase
VVNGALLRVDRETTDLAPGLWGAVADRLAAAHVVVLSDYAKGVLDPLLCDQILHACAVRGVPVVVDPKGDLRRFRGAAVLTPNEREARTAAGSAYAGADLHTVAARLLEDLPGSALVITQDRRGLVRYDACHAPLALPAHAPAVEDAGGAGDTLVAAIALGLGAGLPLDDALPLANRAAGVAVGKMGTTAVSWREL